MTSILLPVIVILSLVMIAAVLVQKSKGGGLAAGFQSSNQIMGAPKTADFLEKATWSVMAAIAVLCIVCTVTTHKGTAEQTSALKANAVEAPMGVQENVETSAEASAE